MLCLSGFELYCRWVPLTISRLHVRLGRFNIEWHYGNVSITRLRRKQFVPSKQSYSAVRLHTHPVVSFLNFKNQVLLLSSSPSFLVLFSLSYLIILASVLFNVLLSRVCFCAFPESFSLHLGSMGVDAYDGLFYIYWWRYFVNYVANCF